jgi:hypothetical protein
MLRIRAKATGRIRRGVAGVAVVPALLFAAACGHNDSTASSTPTLKTSTTTATTAAPAPATATTGDQPSAEAPAPTATSAPAERPQPAEPSATADDSQQPLSGKDQALLDELRKRGINPSTPDIALTTAQYVCQSKAAGASDQEMSTYVNAMAGADPSFDPQKMPVEQAGKIYIDVATQIYCNK